MKLLIALLIGLGLYLAQLYLYRHLWDKGLNVSLDFGTHLLREGEGNKLIETISNDKILPLPVVQVKFSLTRTFEFEKMEHSAVTDRYYRNDFFSLLSYRRITRTYDFKCTKRGYYTLTDMDVICKDLFLVGMMLRTKSINESVCVLPMRLSPDEIPVSVNELVGRIVDRSNRNEDPFEFAGIREYQPYDAMNRINWKASASNTRMMVNKFNTTFNRRIVIFLNTECHIRWHEEVFLEEGIRLAASLADRFILRHIPVALYSNGCDVITGMPVMIDAGSDPAHLTNIEIALARLHNENRKDDFAGEVQKCLNDPRFDNTECIIISNYRKQDLVDVFNRAGENGTVISWIIPEYSMADTKLTKENKRITKWTVRNAG